MPPQKISIFSLCLPPPISFSFSKIIFKWKKKINEWRCICDLKSNVSIIWIIADKTPPPPAPAPHRCLPPGEKSSDVEAAIKDIRLTLQRTKTLPLKCHPEAECEENEVSPVWIPRQRGLSSTSVDSERKVQSGEEAGDEGKRLWSGWLFLNSIMLTEEADTDLETDRLLGQQRTDDQGFYDDKVR